MIERMVDGEGLSSYPRLCPPRLQQAQIQSSPATRIQFIQVKTFIFFLKATNQPDKFFNI